MGNPRMTSYEVIVRTKDGDSCALPEGREEPFKTLAEADEFALTLCETPGVVNVAVLKREVVRFYNGNDLIAARTKE